METNLWLKHVSRTHRWPRRHQFASTPTRQRLPAPRAARPLHSGLHSGGTNRPPSEGACGPVPAPLRQGRSPGSSPEAEPQRREPTPAAAPRGCSPQRTFPAEAAPWRPARRAAAPQRRAAEALPLRTPPAAPERVRLPHRPLGLTPRGAAPAQPRADLVLRGTLAGQLLETSAPARSLPHCFTDSGCCSV